MNIISLLLGMVLFVSGCYPARDANGHYWKAKQIGKRILSKKEHNPNQPYYTRQQVKEFKNPAIKTGSVTN